ncbi:hypothetical protein DIZ27_17795 [Streptomyces sp. NWU339]|nr:hypothetical protein DIZ27_17795 [Streptomyces sp. NWU339]
MTTPTRSTTGRQRRALAPPPVPQPAGHTTSPPPPQLPDPPIYRDLMRAWADKGRALPGRHDPEWARLAAPWRGSRVSPSAAPRDGGR